MTPFYIPIVNQFSDQPASKARTDIDLVMNDMGFKPICEPFKFSQVEYLKDFKYKEDYIHKVIKSLLAHKEEDPVLFIQYPSYLGNFYLFPKYIHKIEKDYKVVFIIHDLNGVRFSSPYITSIDKDVLNKAYKVISHNEIMSEYLVNCFSLDRKNIINLEIFDYITGEVNKKPRYKTDGVDFPGNLDKSMSFIEQYIKCGISTRLNLYGKRPKDNINLDTLNTKYCGQYPSDVINTKLQGGFGLAWDGDSVLDLNGDGGNYMRINNPYKASLFLISGLPIITSKQSALGKLVSDYKVGLLLDSLEEMPSLISNLKDSDYDQMRNNVIALGEKLIKGHFIKEALNKALAS